MGMGTPLTVDRRGIAIAFSVACPFPKYLHAHVKTAAIAALRGIPRKVLRATLTPGQTYPLSISVVSPRAIRRLNREYRRKDHPTDVLSFSRLEGKRKFFPPDLGDIILCWEVAKKQTATFHTTRPTEIQRLVVHGVLHLFGFDHERGGTEAKRMLRLQEQILRRLR